MQVKFKKPEAFCDIYERKPGTEKTIMHYCPGCGHGNVHKYIAEAVYDLGLQDRTVFISPVGCSVFAYYYFDMSNIQAAHGRAPAVATGIKRVHPDSIAISYQGDGDLAAIGTAEIIHAANRGENMTVIFVNNAIYGMTGGQMAPTTLEGQRTTTSPYGRNPGNEGFPVRVCELIDSLQAPIYIERVSLKDAKHQAKARKAIRKALGYQAQGKGFTLVEVLSTCPTGWGISPVDARKWIADEMEPIFPLGCLRDQGGDLEAQPGQPRRLDAEGIHGALDVPAPGASEVGAGGASMAAIAEQYRNPAIKVAGFGGQGVLLLGLGLASTGMKLGYHVSWLPSYGPEMRGGTANCSVRISEDRIGSPNVVDIDILAAFNLPSLKKFEPQMRPGSTIFYNSSIVDEKPGRGDIGVVAVPATELADGLGNIKAANMVMLGAIAAKTGLFDIDAVCAHLDGFISKKKLIPLNEQAVRKGAQFVQEMG